MRRGGGMKPNTLELVLGIDASEPYRHPTNRLENSQQMPPPNSGTTNLWCLFDWEDQNLAATWRTRTKAAMEHNLPQQKVGDLCKVPTSSQIHSQPMQQPIQVNTGGKTSPHPKQFFYENICAWNFYSKTSLAGNIFKISQYFIFMSCFILCQMSSLV